MPELFNTQRSRTEAGSHRVHCSVCFEDGQRRVSWLLPCTVSTMMGSCKLSGEKKSHHLVLAALRYLPCVLSEQKFKTLLARDREHIITQFIYLGYV